jgi:hypothetical protein
MKYECTNQQENNGKQIIASGNTNTSLTGIAFGTTTDYRYPSTPATWEVIPYDFTITKETPVTLSLGFRTSAGVGAANNTLLYIDNIRLLTKNSNSPGHINPPQTKAEYIDVYSLTGVKLRSKVATSNATQGLPSGIYLIGNKKHMVVR